MDEDLQRDLETLAEFIDVYCTNKHKDAPKSPVDLKTGDASAMLAASVYLCDECAKLLSHAFVKRSSCRFDPKPACKHCPDHCYHPKYRENIKEVMKFAGPKLVLSGRLDYLFHLLF